MGKGTRRFSIFRREAEEEGAHPQPEGIERLQPPPSASEEAGPEDFTLPGAAPRAPESAPAAPREARTDEWQVLGTNGDGESDGDAESEAPPGRSVATAPEWEPPTAEAPAEAAHAAEEPAAEERAAAASARPAAPAESQQLREALGQVQEAEARATAAKQAQAE